MKLAIILVFVVGGGAIAWSMLGMKESVECREARKSLSVTPESLEVQDLVKIACKEE